MGQVFWTAVAVDDPPARGNRIENSAWSWSPDLMTAHDIEDVVSSGLKLRRRHEACSDCSVRPLARGRCSVCPTSHS